MPVLILCMISLFFRRVLELGAGMGICGLIAHKTGAASVVITDGDATTMKYLSEVGRRFSYGRKGVWVY